MLVANSCNMVPLYSTCLTSLKCIVVPFMAVKGMGDVRFARFQFQSHSCQPIFGDVLSLLNHCLIRMQHHKVLGIANDGRLPAFSVAEARESREKASHQLLCCHQRSTSPSLLRLAS